MVRAYGIWACCSGVVQCGRVRDMERRAGALLAGCCALFVSVACGQEARQNHDRAGANVVDGRGVGSVESDGDGAKAGDGARDAGRAQAAPAIVVGFVGGFVGHQNAVHSPVQVAARLKKEYPDGVYVEVFENHRREDAYRRVLKVLDVSGEGRPSDEEKRDARIVIYGMSWGGTETVALAKELRAQKIPVLLTVQVDSVGKIGEDGGVIPANVREAVNFYQDNGLLHGRAEIRAEDAGRTKILGNFRYDYKAKPLACEGYPWWDRWLTKYHTEIECDPAVWGRVEALIRGKLPAAKEKSGAAGSLD